MIYGTAWKEDRTEALVLQAVRAGFRAIDTANQKKHYREDFVGDALLKLYAEGFKRENLWLQSKFTYSGGQDHRLPYDPKAPFRRQVRMSFESTLKNLHTDYLDSFLLHGPQSGQAFTDVDLEVWAEMQALQKEGLTRQIGLSNVGLHHIVELTEATRSKPAAIQNRCYAIRKWDQSVREYCRDNAILYQGFSLLTANPHVLQDARVTTLAQNYGVTPQQIVFKFCSEIGILPLTGTSNLQHMTEDLKAHSVPLTTEDVQLLNTI